MRGMATLASGLARLLGSELMRGALLMSGFACLARFLRVELVSSTLLVRGSTAFAGNLPLLILIH
jgi:hypothetical protein